MPSLSVRKIDEKVYEKLHVRAAKHGISMEEEVQQILSRAVLAQERISEVFLKPPGMREIFQIAM